MNEDAVSDGRMEKVVVEAYGVTEGGEGPLARRKVLFYRRAIAALRVIRVGDSLTARGQLAQE